MKVPRISPFSNGTEAMYWYGQNCELCKKAYKVPEGDCLPDMEETKKLVTSGHECRMKAYIDLGFITGDIPQFIAEQIGWVSGEGMPEKCKEIQVLAEYQTSLDLGIPPKKKYDL